MFTLVARPYTLRVGSLITYDRNEQGQLRNSLGTFTFTDLDVVCARLGRRPSRSVVGAQPLTVGDDAGGGLRAGRVRHAGAGTSALGSRYEVQSGIDDRGGAGAAARPVTRLPAQHDQSPRRVRLVLRLDAGAHRRRNASAWRRDRPKRKSSSAIRRIPIRSAAAPTTTRRDPPTRLDAGGRCGAAALAAHVDRHRSSDSSGHAAQLRHVSTRRRATTSARSTSMRRSTVSARTPTYGRVLLVQSIGRVAPHRLQRRPELLAAAGHLQQRPLRLSRTT